MFVFSVIQALILSIPLVVGSSEPPKQGLGIHIDDNGRFILAKSGYSMEPQVVAQGQLDLSNSGLVLATPPDSMADSTVGDDIWKAVEIGDESATTLLGDIFTQMKQSTGQTTTEYDQCVITTPQKLSSSQRELVSSAALTHFGCIGARIFRDPHAVAFALDIQAGDVDEAPAIIVLQNGTPYVLAEESGILAITKILPPPFVLEDALAAYGRIAYVVFIQKDETTGRFGKSRGPNKTRIRRKPIQTIAEGAALLAARALPQEPVTILPLTLGVVLHGTLSHPVIERHSILPESGTVTLTTVHDNQKTATIEVREGSRPRSEDNLPLVKLVLDGLPAAPAGTLQIVVAITMDQYMREVIVEAIELKSHINDSKVVERDALTYGEGVLEAHEAEEEKHREEDEVLRNTRWSWAPAGNVDHQDAVQLFDFSVRHEEL